MPYSLTTWCCKICNKRFQTYETARDCELLHISDKATSRFRDNLRAIFPKRTKRHA